MEQAGTDRRIKLEVRNTPYSVNHRSHVWESLRGIHEWARLSRQEAVGRSLGVLIFGVLQNPTGSSYISNLLDLGPEHGVVFQPSFQNATPGTRPSMGLGHLEPTH